MADPVEVTLSKSFTPPAPKAAVKLLVEEVSLRITARLVDQDGETVLPSYTFEADVKADSSLRAQALLLAGAAMPDRFPT